MDNLLASKQYRNLQIEGLRGISILIIVLYHVFDRYQQLYLGQEIQWMNFWGSLGVISFFLISGLFAINNTKGHGIKNGINCFCKRFLRLWPTYILALICIFCITHFTPLEDRTVSFFDFLVNAVFLNRYFSIPYVDGSHWYLGTLLTMFLIVSIFQAIGVHQKPLPYIIWLLIEIVIDRFFNTKEIYPIGGPFIGAFCVGIALMRLIRGEGEDSQVSKILWISIIPLGTMDVLLGWRILAGGELIICIVITYLCLKEMFPLIAIKPLVFIGTISYPLYLIHQNLSFVIQNVLTGKFGYSLICPTIAFITMVTLGIVIYYYYEKPMQKIIQASFSKDVDVNKS